MTRPFPIVAAALVGLGVVSAQEPAGKTPLSLAVPESLSAVSGRGEAVLFATNERGERIAEVPKRKSDRVAYKEVTRPLRWAVVVGTLDLRAIHATAPAPPPNVGPWWPGKRIDLDRQQRRAGGGWTDWAPVDADANLTILDNLTEVEDERVPHEARMGAFVDPLPFLKSGEWLGVDVEAFVDRRLDDARVRGRRLVVFPRRPDGPAAPGPGADTTMIRVIDFTVLPGSTYRYRARVVAEVPGPRGGKEVLGPWSEPIGEVTIPKE